MSRQNPIIRHQLNNWYLRRVPFPPVPFVNYFSEDPLINGAVFAKDLRSHEIEQIRHDILAEGFSDVQPWSWVWARKNMSNVLGMGKTALLTYVCDQINRDFGQSFFNQTANWLALYVPVLARTRTLDQVATYALASFCSKSRGLSIEQRLLARLRRRVVVKNADGKYPSGLGSITVFQFLKEDWLANHNISRSDLDHDVEQLLVKHNVSAPVARAVAANGFSEYLASLNGSTSIIPSKTGLLTKALGILMNDVANIAIAASISKITLFVDDFYFIVRALPPAERQPLAANIRNLVIDGPYTATRTRLFDWVAVMHTTTAFSFAAGWKAAGMDVVASLTWNEESSVMLRGFTPAQGRALLQEYLRYHPNRLPKAPSEIYPFTEEALDAIVSTTRKKDPSVGDPSIPPRNLMQVANDIVHKALMEQTPIPIGPEFVAHVVNGAPLPALFEDDEKEEADTEEPRPSIACPCGCHDESVGDSFDVMAVISGSGNERKAIRHYCQNCNDTIIVEAKAV